MRIARALPGCVLLLALALVGCERSGASTSPDDSGAGSSDDASEGTGSTVAGPAIVGKELPPELLAELRLRGDDPDGRLVTLAPGFIATAACSDCGAPSYLWFLAVRCSDPNHCEVLTEQCEGKISRSDDAVYELDFHAVEGGAEDSAAVCAGYTGTFEAP